MVGALADGLRNGRNPRTRRETDGRRRRRRRTDRRTDGLFRLSPLFLGWSFLLLRATEERRRGKDIVALARRPLARFSAACPCTPSVSNEERRSLRCLSHSKAVTSLARGDALSRPSLAAEWSDQYAVLALCPPIISVSAGVGGSSSFLDLLDSFLCLPSRLLSVFLPVPFSLGSKRKTSVAWLERGGVRPGC